VTKPELSELLHKLNIPVNEGITSENNTNRYPRIVYYPYIEEDIVASGDNYLNLATYQIDFFAREPQHEKYRELRKILQKEGLHPQFYHEYIEKDPIYAKTWHTYFSLEVIEDE